MPLLFINTSVLNFQRCKRLFLKGCVIYIMFSNWSAVPNSANINFTNYSIAINAAGTKVFAYNSIDGNFQYSLFNGTTYTNWTPVPNLAGVVFLGSIDSSIVLHYSADGNTICAQSGLGTDSNVYYATYNGTTYTSWTPVPNQNALIFRQGVTQGGINIVISADGTNIMALSVNSDFYYSFWNGTTFTNWTSIPNNLAIGLTSIAITSRDNTKIVSYSATTQELFYALYTGSTYTNWIQIPNPTGFLFINNIQILNASADCTKVFALDDTNTPCYSLYSAGQYSPWVAVPNPNMLTFAFTFGVNCTTDGTKLYNQDNDSNYYYSVYNGVVYSSWTLLPNTNGIALLNCRINAVNNDGTKLFLTTADNSIYYSLYTNAMYSSWLLVPNAANIAFTVYTSFNTDGTIFFAKSSAPGLNSYYTTFNGTGYTNWIIIPNSLGIVFEQLYLLNNDGGTKVFSQSADTNGNYYFSQIVPTPTPTPLISDICFPAGTPVKTDQGIIAIDKINTLQHTINGKRILHITQTVSEDKYLICIEKGALGKNTPMSRTVMSKNHKILYEASMVPVERLLDLTADVKKVKYDGQLLYNILLEKHGVVQINNLICETLHPDNRVAKLYNTLLKKSVSKNRPLNQNTHVY